jgi:ligand-binding sensor domain-containing protein/two-component sensor histidine kinase
LQSCKENSRQVAHRNDILYLQPFTVPLNIDKGYPVNKITGDSVQPLINSVGEAIQTGKAIPFIGTKIDPAKTLKPSVIKAGTPQNEIIATNIHPAPEKISVVSIDTSKLKKVKLGEGKQTSSFQNSKSRAVTGVPITVKGIEKKVIEVKPVKALPLRSKDAATSHIQYLDVEQGLSYSFVYAVLEDQRGNLWFGMDGTGMTKYDGVNFYNYTTREGLVENTVISIVEDKKGNIWFGTYGGVSKFDGTKFTEYTKDQGMLKSQVSSIYEDHDENMWFNSESGSTKFDGKNFIHYTVKEGLPSDTVYACTQDRKGNMWFATHKGIARFDGKMFTWFEKENNTISITSILEDKQGNIWFGSTNNGLFKFDGTSIAKYTVKEGLSSNMIWSLMEDNNGAIWISTSFGGINKFDGKKFTNYNIKEGLSNSKVRQIIQDRSGNIWFGTDGGGVNKLKEAGFQYIVPDDMLRNNRVRPIIKDNDGNVWLGTEGGGVGRIKIDPGRQYEISFNYYTAKDGIFDNGQRALMKDKEKNIWIGTTGGGLTKFDGVNFTNYSLQQGLSSVTVMSLLEDSRGNIWVGTRVGGITKYDKEADKAGNSYFTHYKEKDGVYGPTILSIIEDSKGNIWFGTDGFGVGKYDGAHLINYTEREGLFAKTVTSIFEDKKGNIWFGTSAAGICRFDGKNFTYYTEKNGLSNNNVWSINEDSSGNIWTGTDRGHNVFVPGSDNNYTIYNFGLNDGLKAIDFNLRSVCIDNTNRIWWGTGKNIATRDLNIPFKNYDVSSLKLNSLDINGIFYDYRNLTKNLSNNMSFSGVNPYDNNPNDLTLAYNQNHLTFHFSAIDWSAPDKIKYSYRLLGLENNWSDPSPDAFADYRNLVYGHYELQIKAIGQSQVWTAPISYKFTIRPAWWQTWWFKAATIVFAIIAIICVLWLIYLYRLRKQKILLEKKLAVQYERQRISADLHDDIGSTLSSINIYAGLAKKQSDNQLYLDSISQNINEVVGKLDDLVWSIKAGHDTLGNIADRLRLYAEPITRSKEISFSISINDDLKEVKPPEGIKHHLYMTTKELINNAIKHADCKNIKIEFKNAGDNLNVVIKDDGKGFNESTIRKDRNGLKNITQRVKEMDGEIDIRSSLKDGTIVSIEIPV